MEAVERTGVRGHGGGHSTISSSRCCRPASGWAEPARAGPSITDFVYAGVTQFQTVAGDHTGESSATGSASLRRRAQVNRRRGAQDRERSGPGSAQEFARSNRARPALDGADLFELGGQLLLVALALRLRLLEAALAGLDRLVDLFLPVVERTRIASRILSWTSIMARS